MRRNLPRTRPRSLRRGARGRHRDRAPAVLGRVAVVWVDDALQPRLRRRADERVLDALGVPARGREEERGHRLALVGDDLPVGGRHGGVGARALGGDAPVDLRARVGVLVEAVAERSRARRDRVRAGGDGLGLELLGRPRRRALGADHAAHVGLEVDRVDGVDAAAGGPQLQRAAVAAVAHAGHRRAGQEQRAARRRLHAHGRRAGEQALRARAQHEPAAAADDVVGPRPGPAAWPPSRDTPLSVTLRLPLCSSTRTSGFELSEPSVVPV